MLVWLEIEADGDVMWSLDRETGGDVIFSVESEMEAEGRGDWTDSNKSQAQSHESTEAKNRDENSSSTLFEKDDDGRSTCENRSTGSALCLREAGSQRPPEESLALVMTDPMVG
jgi:hypothetical protein